MELLFILAAGGALVGLFVNMLWASVDAVFGMSSLTSPAGVIGICIVLAEAIGWGMILYDELRS